MGNFVEKDEFSAIRKTLKKEEKTIGLCHGVFDLIHPGHIVHFEEAKKKCDVLVVSITSEEYVRKGPGRPYFNDDLRLKFLSALSVIDYVMLSDGYTADDIVSVVQPDFYIKGADYAKSEDDITGKIDDETNLVKSFGGQVYFTSGETFSSTNLLNKNFPVLTPEIKSWMMHFAEKYNFKEIKEIIDSFKNIKTLVIGDVIIDEYLFCSVQGMMSKDRGYSSVYDYEERYLGGSLSIARHIAQFTDDITICSAIGNETDIHSMILNNLSKDMKIDIEYFDDLNTITKKRYIAQNVKRDTLDKIFSVNNLPDKALYLKDVEDVMLKKINAIIDDFDLVVVADFGHGLMTPKLMELIQRRAKHLALNCQTNSTNHGVNLITKYEHANMYSLDQRELMLAMSDNTQTDDKLLSELWEKFNHRLGFLTRGAYGAMAISETGEVIDCPAFTLTVKDTVGAGDAFFSMASLCSSKKLNSDLSLFLSNVAAALATNIVGNKESISKVNVLKYVSTLLNF